MIHKFLEPGFWFAPKKFGYGSGLPIAWQGWVLMIGYILLILGIASLLEPAGAIGTIAVIAVIILVTIPFLLIVRRRTEGGWKWRP